MSLLNNIQNLCPSKNTTIPKLEKELGFSKGSMYKWDINDPSISKVLKVAQYFGVSIDSLFKDSQEDLNIINQ
ncbi:helix-turn-helix transcriptional regulator [Pelosinus sp. IPA-1]|uniref:helix-turn-helix domain-containing protein n=1 Tax=Pelosinus sp. IPA-1 TaxID=3029569 RepID=UPI002436196B|nr:helix-turn-helix transcriptional regulator [Pelosinus sp. IPA-1]GMB00883.1 hypothetical protein PIPA1_36820 [Pelosinus sp. IPA-1]